MIVNYAVSVGSWTQFQESSVESQWLEFGTRVRLCSPRIEVTLRGNELTCYLFSCAQALATVNGGLKHRVLPK